MSAKQYGGYQSDSTAASTAGVDTQSTISEATRDPLLNLQVEETARQDARKRFCVGCGIFTAILLLIIIIVVAVETTRNKHNGGSDSDNNSESEYEKLLLQSVTADQAREYLRSFAHYTRVPGSDDASQASETIQSLLSDMGWSDKMKVDRTSAELWTLNEVRLSQLNSMNESIWNASFLEPSVSEDSDTSEASGLENWPILAYSASGLVSSNLVYVNYAREEDFDTLVRQKGMDLRGLVGIARYGKIFRGSKPIFGAKYGLSGMVIYSDPADDGAKRGNVYPNGPWRPALGLQRGSVSNGVLCPGDPSESRLRDQCGNATKKDFLTPIPVVPLSWLEASHLMRQLSGVACVEGEGLSGFQGGMNFTYHLGGGKKQNGADNDVIVQLKVDGEYQSQTIENIIVEIEGSNVENGIKDTVLIGSHRDAWVFGAADDGSGQAAWLNVAKGLSEIYKQGWRPQRTVVLASWDAEEWNWIGSTYFSEMSQYQDYMRYGVAYLNLDMVVAGHTLEIEAFPIVEEIIQSTFESVDSPDSNYDTLWQYWEAQEDHEVSLIGDSSDYVSFQHHVGIPSLDMSFKGMVGAYHSLYDTVWRMESFIDPDYEYHRAISQAFALMVLSLSDRNVIPYSLSYLTNYLVDSTDYIFDDLLPEYKCSPPGLSDWQSTISENIAAFDDEAYDLDIQGMFLESDKSLLDYQVQAVNQAYRDIGRQFLDVNGLPDRPYLRNVLFSVYNPDGEGIDEWPQVSYAVMNGCDDSRVLNALSNTSLWIVRAKDYLADQNGKMVQG